MTCSLSFSLLVSQASGAWSGDSGKCVLLTCPPLGNSDTLTVKNHATAVFAREGGTTFDPAGDAPVGSTVRQNT